ncbi:MAG: Ldh family oxidoreductase [Candidatus Eremiobacteraeota bacterium]|nr:Ldh family oxidoreductase [Candidatus Eremiobacteraeota bacterium]
MKDSISNTVKNGGVADDVATGGEGAVRMERTRYDAAELHAFVRRALVAANVTDADATLAATVLVASDLRGIESHGVARLEKFYIDRIRDGYIDPQARERVLRETPTSLAIDAQNALGHPVGVRAMRRTIEKAAQSGCAVATVARSNHFGIAGYYAMLALDRDMIGIASTNAGRLAAPTGGRELMLGTNPFAYAIPAESGDAFVLDMATTTVALGKLEIARRLGKPLRPGWAIDANGTVTLDPVLGMNGALLPLGGYGTDDGGHKGYGLGLLADILCAVLGGGVFAPNMPQSPHLLDPAITSQFFAAIRIDAFRDVADFKRDLSRLLADMRTSAPAPGFERVYTAGEPEALRESEHRERGIGLDPVVVASLESVAKKLAIAPPRVRAS